MDLFLVDIYMYVFVFRLINPKTFNYIVQQTGLPSHKFLNLQGPVQILLGLRSARFLPTSIHLPDSFQKLFDLIPIGTIT